MPKRLVSESANSLRRSKRERWTMMMPEANLMAFRSRDRKLIFKDRLIVLYASFHHFIPSPLGGTSSELSTRVFLLADWEPIVWHPLYFHLHVSPRSLMLHFYCFYYCTKLGSFSSTLNLEIAWISVQLLINYHFGLSFVLIY